jgi:hypothetical protein
VLPNENPEEFNRLVSQFHHDFHPSDVIETSLVRELAVITWKKLRLERLEQDYFIKKLNAPASIEELAECGLQFTQERYNFWVKGDTFDEDTISKFKRTLDLIKSNLRNRLTVDQLRAVKALNPIIYQSLIDFFRKLEPLASPELSDEELVDKTVRFENQSEQYITSVIFERFVTLIEAGLWCIKRFDEIDQAVIQIKQQRLLKIMQSDEVRRTNDDLSRSLMRTLEQFRKHNQWRMKHHVIEANEE